MTLSALTPQLVGIATSPETILLGTEETQTVLVSGSSLHISGDLADFQEISPEPTERISGVGGQIADGRPCGFRGILKRNIFGTQEGIYIPTLVGRRLISVAKLTNDNWEITLRGNQKSFLKRGKVIIIRFPSLKHSDSSSFLTCIFHSKRTFHVSV